MTPLLKIRGLCKDFRSGGLSGGKLIQALRDVDLEVFAGDTVGLVGESGSGKTTLARCALRLIEPAAGTIHFEGSDLRLLSAEALRMQRRRFQIIFQDPAASLDPRMTIEEVLLEPYRAHQIGESRERTTWISGLLAAVSLDNSILRRYPSQLSGGQQQRVVIARALALKPRLLIADEPVSALDASVQAQLLNLLADLRRRFAVTLILISHSLAAVHYLCTRVVVMYLGRIVEEADADHFFDRPKHPYSQILLRSTPSLKANRSESVEVPAGVALPPHTPLSGCPFHPRCIHAMSRCREELPQLSSHSDGGKVACFLFE